MPTPPAVDEIEISIFGPGYGESILVHIPGGQWIVVDSCTDPITKIPTAITYLENIGVDVSTKVAMVVATHWHDDHIRGLSTVVEKCKSAQFALSSALRCDEFLNLVNALGSRSLIRGNSGLDEFSKILNIMLSRKIPPILASENQCIWANANPDYNCRIYALSPSDYAKLQVAQDFDKLFPNESEPKRRIFPAIPNINHIAVALWLQIGDFAILLGSDLEDNGTPHSGWTRIANATTRPNGRAHVFKIPHHGSETAECEDVWSNMLIANPLSICTPYNRGTFLPKDSDIKRICDKTMHAYITASKNVKEVGSKRIWHVDKLLRKNSRIKFLSKPFIIGQVRSRFNVNSPQDCINVQVFNNACNLNTLI